MAVSEHAPALPISRRAMMSTGIAATTLAAVPVLGGTSHPDADLLRLGSELDTAWENERRAYARTAGIEDPIEEAAIIDPACDACSEIVDQIWNLPARTLDGLHVKTKALRWCYCDEPINIDRDNTTDAQIAMSISRDLIQMLAVKS